MSSVLPNISPSGRRTQEERRTATRAVLLEATIAALVEHGYRGTTTLAVERRAGVSRGARIHHFANKAALLAGVGDYLYAELSDFYDEAFGGPQRRDESDFDRLRHGLRELWAIYQRPHFTAVLELFMAGRTDPELQEALYAVATRHRQLALDAAKKYFPVLDEHQSRTLIELIHAAFLGMRLHSGVSRDRECIELVLAGLEDSVANQLMRQLSSK